MIGDIDVKGLCCSAISLYAHESHVHELGLLHHQLLMHLQLQLMVLMPIFITSPPLLSLLFPVLLPQHLLIVFLICYHYHHDLQKVGSSSSSPCDNAAHM